MKLNQQIVLIACAGFLAATTFCFASETNAHFALVASATTNRPASWARPLILPGVTNFYEVTTNLYRGAQPTVAGMKELKAMGIKTVINLRSFHSDKDEVVDTGLKSIRFEVKPWHAEEEDVVGFLKAVTDTNNLPVFVHCQRGADRTGMMCAMYRIVVCGWTKPEAIEEMKQGGYRFSPVWKNLVAFIEKADIADIKRRAGISAK
jgi:protein tyrosine/serine phosphatase